MDVQSQQLPLPDGVRLHPEAHITAEIWQKLKSLIQVGNPERWMLDIMEGGPGITLEQLPTEFQQTFALLASKRAELNEHLSNITYIANNSTPDIIEDRIKYQTNELSMMMYVTRSLLQHLENPDSTKIIYALRGALFFKPILQPFATSELETEVKRVRALDIEDKSTFLVGIGEVGEPDINEVENIKTLLMPDDCLSTGMTQIALLEELFIAGYMPTKVVMMFTVATTAGIDYVYKRFSQLINKYGIYCELILQCGALCNRVDDSMYLRTDSGEGYAVGDMGNWNMEVPKSLEN